MLKSVIFKLAEGGLVEIRELQKIAGNAVVVRRVENLFPEALDSDPARTVKIAEVTVSAEGALKQFIEKLSSHGSIEYAHLPKKRDLL